jgi:hypothetical protein
LVSDMALLLSDVGSRGQKMMSVRAAEDQRGQEVKATRHNARVAQNPC